MNTLPAEPSSLSPVSSLRLTCDMLFAIVFLTLLSAATADILLGRFLAAAGALAATLFFGWIARRLIRHVDRWNVILDD